MTMGEENNAAENQATPPVPDTGKNALSAEQVKALVSEAAAIDWIRDAYSHLKVIGFNKASAAIFERASVETNADEGMVDVSEADLKIFCAAAKKHRIWDRELNLRS